jgi:hypothetical protein
MLMIQINDLNNKMSVNGYRLIMHEIKSIISNYFMDLLTISWWYEILNWMNDNKIYLFNYFYNYNIYDI